MSLAEEEAEEVAEEEAELPDPARGGREASAGRGAGALAARFGGALEGEAGRAGALEGAAFADAAFVAGGGSPPPRTGAGFADVLAASGFLPGAGGCFRSFIVVRSVRGVSFVAPRGIVPITGGGAMVRPSRAGGVSAPPSGAALGGGSVRRGESVASLATGFPGSGGGAFDPGKGGGRPLGLVDGPSPSAPTSSSAISIVGSSRCSFSPMRGPDLTRSRAPLRNLPCDEACPSTERPGAAAPRERGAGSRRALGAATTKRG